MKHDLRLVRSSLFDASSWACGLSAARAKAFLHRGDQAFGIKDGFVFEHEINSPSQFDRHDRISFEFVAAHFLLQSLR